MWDYFINIHPSELLSKKTKESRINECIKMDNLHFIPNNILTKKF